MKLRPICGFVILLLIGACALPTTKNNQTGQSNTTLLPAESKSGLIFDHSGYRGTEYTDSLGTEYNLRSNPISITNDTLFPIQVQIDFANEYSYPPAYGEEEFRVFPLPKEWAQDGTTDSMYVSMFEKLPNHISNPSIRKIIKPGEKMILAIGTIYPKPGAKWSVVPNELFAHDGQKNFPACEWHLEKDPSSNSGVAIGLKLVLNQTCLVIPCGQISYLEH